MDEFFSNHFFIFDESNERTERKGEFAIDSVLASPFFTKSRTNLFFLMVNRVRVLAEFSW